MLDPMADLLIRDVARSSDREWPDEGLRMATGRVWCGYPRVLGLRVSDLVLDFYP